MGKAQKKKAMRRHNPIRVPDSHLGPGLAAAATTSTKTEAILPIMQKIESSDATDRAWACAAVSNLIHNDPSTRRLLQGKNIVGALITRLSDPVDEVVVESAGALRNLCIDGGYDICAEMYNKNILEPLKAFIPKISTTLESYLSTDNNAMQDDSHPINPSLVFQLAENVVTIFWCLSETSNKALNAINNVGLIPYLMSFLEARDKFPAHLILAAAQCVYVLSDDNTPAIEAIKAENSHILCLLGIARPEAAGNGKITDDEAVSLRVLICGILKNISPLPTIPPAAPVDLDRTIILPLLVPLLSSVSLEQASSAVSNLALNGVSTQPSTNKLHPSLPQPDHKSPNEIELEKIESKLRTVQMGLEILTNVCASFEDGEWDDIIDGDEAMQDENEKDDEQDEVLDMDDVATPSHPKIDDDLEPKGTETSLLSTLTPPLLSLAHPTQLSFPPSPDNSIVASASIVVHPPTTSALGTIHVRALECLNNLFMVVKVPSPEDVNNDDQVKRKAVIDGAIQVWGDVWGVLVSVGAPAPALPGSKNGKEALGGGVQERRREMWETGVGVLWGLGRLCRGVLVPNEEQVKVLMEFCDTTTDEKIRVQCIGILGCLAQYASAVDANRVISTYLLSSITQPKGSESALQAVSEIIDVFSDEGWAYDLNFRQGNMLGTLSSSLGSVRRIVRSIDVKKGGRSMREWAEGILQNLQDFVKYRRSLKL